MLYIRKKIYARGRSSKSADEVILVRSPLPPIGMHKIILAGDRFGRGVSEAPSGWLRSRSWIYQYHPWSYSNHPQGVFVPASASAACADDLTSQGGTDDIILGALEAKTVPGVVSLTNFLAANDFHVFFTASTSHARPLSVSLTLNVGSSPLSRWRAAVLSYFFTPW